MPPISPHADRPSSPLPWTLTYAEARRRGLSDRRLRELVAAGDLLRLGHGVYRRADAPLADEELIEVAARAPDATLCLMTALARHDLTDRIPTRIDVALPRGRRAPRVEALVRWHRFDPATFHIGRDVVDLDDGVRIGVYRPERCIIDAFRLRHIVGEDVAVEAVRRWLRRQGSTPSSLLTLARAFPKAAPALRATLQVLL